MALRVEGNGRLGQSAGFGQARVGRKMSRTQERIKNNLGVIPGSKVGGQLYRSSHIEMLDKYLENRQYEGMPEWDAGTEEGEYIPIKKRKPRIIYPFGKRLTNTVSSKLAGDSTWPQVKIDDDPDTEAFLQLIGRHSMMRTHVLHAIRRMVAHGSSFLRYYIVGATIKLEIYKSHYCYPVFDDEGNLQEVTIRYVYTDWEDTDENGKPKKKWYQLYLGQNVDILYDNPEYKASEEPMFEEISRAEHMLGFVQGEWFRTFEEKHRPDGPSILADITGFIDCLNYSISQADQALAYAHEPQLGISGMDVDEIDKLVKSSEKAWNLGRSGDAKFIEADLSGVERGMDFRERIKQHIGDVARVVMLDPEKIVGHAQSAKAMEVLHGPLLDLVHELRPNVELAVKKLYQKLAVTVMMLEQRGENNVINMPKGYKPKSLDITFSWPPVFPMTMEDLQKKVQVGAAASNASLISRESVTAWIAKDFGIENVEEEIIKIANQPQLNPFGSMF